MRLIDANKLMEHLTRCIDAEKGLFRAVCVAIKCFVEQIPTVDAVEVVHGRWEPVDHDGSWRVDMCSVCHRRMHYVDYDQPYQYCPNCGADMRGDGNG